MQVSITILVSLFHLGSAKVLSYNDPASKVSFAETTTQRHPFSLDIIFIFTFKIHISFSSMLSFYCFVSAICSFQVVDVKDGFVTRNNSFELGSSQDTQEQETSGRQDKTIYNGNWGRWMGWKGTHDNGVYKAETIQLPTG